MACSLKYNTALRLHRSLTACLFYLAAVVYLTRTLCHVRDVNAHRRQFAGARPVNCHILALIWSASQKNNRTEQNYHPSSGSFPNQFKCIVNCQQSKAEFLRWLDFTVDCFVFSAEEPRASLSGLQSLPDIVHTYPPVHRWAQQRYVYLKISERRSNPARGTIKHQAFIPNSSYLCVVSHWYHAWWYRYTVGCGQKKFNFHGQVPRKSCGNVDFCMLNTQLLRRKTWVFAKAAQVLFSACNLARKWMRSIWDMHKLNNFIAIRPNFCFAHFSQFGNYMKWKRNAKATSNRFMIVDFSRWV